MTKYSFTYTDMDSSLKGDLTSGISDSGIHIDIDEHAEWLNTKSHTITGELDDSKGVGVKGLTVSVGGAAAIPLAYTRIGTTNKYTFSYSYDGADTKGTTLIFKATDTLNQTSVKSDTIKSDQTPPEITITPASAGYTAVGSDLHWYKKDASVTISASAADETSGVKGMTRDDHPYDSGTVIPLDTSAEMENPAIINFGAADNAGNTTTKTFKYDVDGTDPLIGTVSISNITGDSKYVDCNGKIWFKKGVTNVTVTVNIADEKSGLHDAFIGSGTCTRTYKDGAFSNIDTSIESEQIMYDITAADNVGNTIKAENAFSFGVDGSGPSISVSHVPSDKFTTSVDVTAVIKDELSGIATQQYSFDGKAWYDYTGTFTVTDNSLIIFKAVDKVGNVNTVPYLITNIDTIPPVVSISADTITIQESVIFTVTAEDDDTNITKMEYSTDNGGTWTECTITPDQKTVTTTLTATDNNSTYQFRAYDQALNVSKIEAVTFNNIYNGSEKSFEVIGDKEVTQALPVEVKTLTLTEESKLTVEKDATVAVKDMEMTDAGVVNNGGNVSASTLSISGTENYISGDIIEAGTIILSDKSQLKLNKDQYDSFMVFSKFLTENGKLIVSSSSGNALRTNNIDTLMDKSFIANVEFKQDLIDINKLNFKNTKATEISFEDAYGTSKNDTIRFCKNTNIIFGTEGKLIDLEEGSNTVQIDKNAVVKIKSKLVNVTNIKSASASTVELTNVECQLDHNAVLKAEGTSFIVGNVQGSNKTTSLTTGTGTIFKVNTFDFGDKNDKISVGKDSLFYAEEIDFGEGSDTFNVGARAYAKITGNVTGVCKLTLSNGSCNSKIGSDLTEFEAKKLTGTTKHDTFNFGSYTDADIDGVIDLGTGNDTLKLGSYGNLKSNSIVGAETISLKACSSIKTGDIKGVKKFTVSNGSSKNGGAAVAAANIFGTTGNDTFNFGSYTEEDIDGVIDLGTGNDTLKLGSYGDFKSNSIVGAETISFGACSSTKTGDIAGVKKFTVSNGSSKNARATIVAANVFGTTGNDTFNFGSYNYAELDSLNFGNGNDTLKIGNDAKVIIKGSLDFGDGNDTLNIGKRSKLGVDTLDNLNKLTMGSDSELWIADEKSYLVTIAVWGNKYGTSIKNGTLSPDPT